MVECNDLDVLVREELLPSVSLVGGLPDGAVFEMRMVFDFSKYANCRILAENSN